MNGPAEADIFEPKSERLRFIIGHKVKERHRHRSTAQRLRPDLRRSDAVSLKPQPVLVDCNNFRVHQNAFGRVVHPGQVVTCNKWRGENSPKAHLSTVLVWRHATITHLQHVWIVPVARPRVFLQPSLRETNKRHAAITVTDVVSRTPNIPSHFRTPFPHGTDAVFAEAVHD